MQRIVNVHSFLNHVLPAFVIILAGNFHYLDCLLHEEKDTRITIA